MSDVRLTRGEIARIELRPGDRLVITVPTALSEAEYRRISEHVEAWAPGVPALLLDGGARLSVLSRSE